MSRFTKWLSLLLLFLLLGGLAARVPGYGALDGVSFHVGQLLVDVIDPLVVLLAIGAALRAGGLRGAKRGASFLLRGVAVQREQASSRTPESDHVAASRSLAAAGRGLLWGACALNSIYVASFYLSAPSSAGLLNSARLDYVKFGAILAVTLGAFILIPSAEASAELSVRHASRARPLSRAADALATLGLFGCALTALLSILMYRAPVIGAAGSERTFILPSSDGIDVPFAIWSLVTVPVVASLAFFFAARTATRAGSRASDWNRFAGMSLGAGVLVATLVELAGLRLIANTGGQGNPAELASLAGRMLVPVAVGALIGVGAQLLPAAAARSRPAPERSS